MTTIATITPTTTTVTEDDLFTVAQLSALGHGHPQTIRANIRTHSVPTTVLDGRGTLAVRAGDLHLLPKPIRRDGSELDALVEQIVKRSPRLSDKHKAEIGRLLSAPTN